jgi:peptidylamidoglycolate lyase
MRFFMFLGCAAVLSAAQPTLVYKVAPNWPALPEGMKLEPVTGVALDGAGRVWVLHRSKEHPVVCIDPVSGKVLETWGKGLFGSPHGLTIDRHGNFWITDTDLHQVFRFSRDHKLTLTLGERGAAGADARHFNKPTATALSPKGDLFVADGYGNSRVVKFTADGKFIKEWGTKGDKPGQFDLPHSIAIDSGGHVYVADRNNARVQVFDTEGRFQAEWKSKRLGRPWGVAVGPDGFIYVVDGGNATREPTERNRAFRLNRNGQFLDEWGSFGREPGQFFWAHAVAAGRDGAVYVAEVDQGSRVQKFVKQ